VLVQFGRRIVQLREEKDWSRADLARRLGVSRERLAHWERGEHHPPLAVLWALRRELEVTIDELVTGEPAPPVGLSREQKAKAVQHLAALKRLMK
jgi:transcriptional regulator with XRE-family HTH domain